MTPGSPPKQRNHAAERCYITARARNLLLLLLDRSYIAPRHRARGWIRGTEWPVCKAENG